MTQEKFKNKSGFILASVGAAVGLGNALRFPGLCAKYGGGAYLMIYLAGMLILGLPLLNAEIALGRKYGGGAPKCMQSLKNGGSCVGWASCINSVLTAFIYAGLASWIIATIVNIVPLSMQAGEMTQTQISNHFFDEVLAARSDGAISGISPLVCIGIAIVWALMFFCVKGGARALSGAAKITVFAPVILLMCMAVRGMFYENSGTALSALFLPDFSALSSPALWLSATGQVIFSLSVVVGIMPAFGAYLPDKTDVFSCTLIIAAADFFVSVLASVVLFTTLYGCGLQSEIGQSGIITAFAVYPVAITKLFGANAALNAAAGVLFYSSLAMIAVQSSVSMLEAFVAPFSENFGIKKTKVAAVICAVGFAVSTVYATTAAVVLVDLSDRFINFYNILLLGVAECFIIARSRQMNGIVSEINRYTKKLRMPRRFFKISVGFLSPSILVSLTAYEVTQLVTQGLNYPVWMQAGFGWGLSLAVFAASLLLEKLCRRDESVVFVAVNPPDLQSDG